MRSQKSLGQHFLTSKRVARDMASIATSFKTPDILEIGPGTGALTRPLLEQGLTVTAVEKDHKLVDRLKATFEREIQNGQLRLISRDILRCDLREVGLRDHAYSVAANIPYYITGKLISYFLENEIQPKHTVLLLQKEVAERIARDEKGSLLSMGVRAYGEPRYEQTVLARLFKPKPKVDSAIVVVTNISRDRFKRVPEQTFFKILKQGFAHKRKKLFGNLSSHTTVNRSMRRTFAYPPQKLKSSFKKLGLDDNVRAEELSVEQWFELAEQLSR